MSSALIETCREALTRQAGVANEASELQAVRREYFERFVELGVPTRRHEDWRYTNLKGLLQSAPDWVNSVASKPQATELTSASLGPWDVALVFVDGHYDARLSRHHATLEGIDVETLADALARVPKEASRLLDARVNDAPFVALNAAFAAEGVRLRVRRGATPPETLALLFVNTGQRSSVIHPRVVITLEENSALTVFEQHRVLGDGAAPYWTNAVVQIEQNAASRLRYIKLHQEGSEGHHTAYTSAQLERDSTLAWHGVVVGQGLVRNELNVRLQGSGASATLTGVGALRSRQHADFAGNVTHIAPHCISDQLFKNVVDERASGALCGKVVVAENAQKSYAEQNLRNLLLAETASANTKPQLEIYADDVKCAHGATVGQLDEAALFYLRSRGLSEEDARRLCTLGFLSGAIDRIEPEDVRNVVDSCVRERLYEESSA